MSQKLVTLRLPADVAAALEAQAARELTSGSSILRRALLRELQDCGYRREPIAGGSKSSPPAKRGGSKSGPPGNALSGSSKSSPPDKPEPNALEAAAGVAPGTFQPSNPHVNLPYPHDR